MLGVNIFHSVGPLSDFLIFNIFHLRFLLASASPLLLRILTTDYSQDLPPTRSNSETSVVSLVYVVVNVVVELKDRLEVYSQCLTDVVVAVVELIDRLLMKLEVYSLILTYNVDVVVISVSVVVVVIVLVVIIMMMKQTFDEA